MDVKKITMEKFRGSLHEVVNEVCYQGETYVLQRRLQSKAAVISMARLKVLLKFEQQAGVSNEDNS